MGINKRLLILCYDFPPLNTAGALRAHSWYSHLKQFNIYPIVITKKWPSRIAHTIQKFSNEDFNTEIVQSDQGTIIYSTFNPDLKNKIIAKHGFGKFKLLRKILTARNTILGPLTSRYDDYQFIFIEARNYLQDNKVDLILATGNPFGLFKEAHRLSAEFNIPWIADYRDLYANNHSLNLKKSNRISNYYKSLLEKKWTKNAAYFTTVSETLADIIKENISVDGKIIRNGYNQSLIPSEISYREKVFIISYAGTVYDSDVLDVAVDGISRFLNTESIDKHKVLFKFIGIELNFTNGTQKIINLSKKFANNIIIVENCSNKETIDHLAKSTVLLNMNYLSVSHGIFPVKLYEYLALNKVIINVEVNNEIESGEFHNYLYTSSNPMEISNYLSKFYTDWEKEVPIKNTVPKELISKYSRINQSKLLADLIHDVI